MKLSELAERQTVRFREGKAERTYVAWGEWYEGTLVCSTHKIKPRKGVPQPDFYSIYVEDSDYRAEYGKDDFMPGENGGNGCFVGEVDYLEIEGLTA